MLMGPVFRGELLRTARQRRYYTLRLAYGLVLLLMIGVGYERMRLTQPVTDLADIAAFAARTFEAFGEVQLITLLLLIPAVFGGAIADEKQRKTLHYLMASHLSGGEIILDKVLGRSAHLAVFVAIGAPIVCLLGLFGGISIESVVVAYVGTFSTAVFAIALTVLISTLARRVRDAIVISYLLVLMWLFVPPLIFLFGSAFRPAPYFWIRPVNDWLADMSPVNLEIRRMFWMPLGQSVQILIDRFLWMVGSQLTGAAILLLVAIWRLRPTFSRHEETRARGTWFRSKGGRRRSRWFAHPECGDDPIAWKERYFTPTDRFTRLVLLPAVIFVTLPLALITEVQGDFSRTVVAFARQGLAALRSVPDGFLWALKLDLGWYVAFWLLAVAGASASSVTIEREKDTWISLSATPLSGQEIVRGKVRGSLWHQRGFAAVLVFLWALGLITGAAHPLGVLASIAMVALLSWFVTTVGVYCSLRASNTSRSMTTALLVLAAFNGYPLILLLWFVGAMDWKSSFAVLGAMPWLAAQSMFSAGSFDAAWRAAARTPLFPPMTIFLSGMLLAVLAIYSATALALRQRIIGELDRWLERRPNSRAPVPARDLEEVAAR